MKWLNSSITRWKNLVQQSPLKATIVMSGLVIIAVILFFTFETWLMFIGFVLVVCVAAALDTALTIGGWYFTIGRGYFMARTFSIIARLGGLLLILIWIVLFIKKEKVASLDVIMLRLTDDADRIVGGIKLLLLAILLGAIGELVAQFIAMRKNQERQLKALEQMLNLMTNSVGANATDLNTVTTSTAQNEGTANMGDENSQNN